MKFVFALLARVLLVGTVLAGPAFAQDAGQPTGDVTLDHGSVWQTKKVGATTQGFLEVHNSGAADDVLTAWDCPIAGETDLVDAAGKPLQSLTIPAGKTVSLAQNGPHLVLQNLHYTVDFGSVLPCAFTFENAGYLGGFLNEVPAPTP